MCAMVTRVSCLVYYFISYYFAVKKSCTFKILQGIWTQYDHMNMGLQWESNHTPKHLLK